jgi:hypothetical protein
LTILFTIECANLIHFVELCHARTCILLMDLLTPSRSLQKYFYRFSKSRGKADYFEGRDDSGVVSARFMDDPGANEEYREFYKTSKKTIAESEQSQYSRLLENCMALGSPTRPQTGKGTVWNDWFASSDSRRADLDRCRILFTVNSVGAGRGTTMLWETNPPDLHAELPEVWTSEQETAATHLQRNLREINAMCATGLIAARVQMLVCEPIPDKWTEWMDSQLVQCGGKPWPLNKKTADDIKMEERPSPLQVVVTASVSSADSCHDLKSGFMEKRMQDLILAPPYLGGRNGDVDSSVKTTHADLVSTDEHDLYVAMRWSTLVTVRAVNSFLQASSDIAAAASSPLHQKPPEPEKAADGSLIAAHGPASPFLLPSFVRVSYVSEENPKVAKWRMHGDFFHPAAWEICKDSFDMTWIPHSLSGAGGVKGLCYSSGVVSKSRNLQGGGEECGQWWVYFTELQMPMSPEVYANELTPPVVQGGSNFFWMLTERQRREVVKGVTCRHNSKDGACPELPQAVMPLGDLESFLINYTPNTALGHHHVEGRQPGYSKAKERDAERQRVKERKQLHDQEEIEKALFEYTIYPAALFHKDATIKAARARDAALTLNGDSEAIGPQTVKSSYYDVTITKPRPPVLGWCQAIARRGLCTLYSDYFRTGNDDRCAEACGLRKNFSKN